MKTKALHLAELQTVSRATIAVGRWIAGVVAGLAICAVCWTAAEVRALRIELTTIRTELDLVKPADVIAELQGLRGELAATNSKLDAAIGTP